MDVLTSVLPWVLASIGMGMGLGYYMGSSKRPPQDNAAGESERMSTLKVLSELVEATEKLTTDVEDRNTEIREVGRNLGDMDVDGELLEVQKQLMKQVTSVLQSNMRLEDDLTYTRGRMEEQAQEIDSARQEARTDPLSGVGNRKAFDEKLKLMLVTARREDSSFVLVMCDIDKFKWINDTHGHGAGDRVVEHVGEFLQSCVRDRDFVGRIGGDEFALMFADLDMATAALVTDRLRRRIAQRNFDLGIGDQEAVVTFSIGVARSWTDATPTAIMERADKALYESKQGGRNKVYCYVDEGKLLPATQLIPKVETPPAESAEEPDEPQVADQSTAPAEETASVST